MKRILIIDDEGKIRNILKELLSSEGYETLEAANAIEAAAIISEKKLDLIILDIRLPGIMGNTIFDLIHKQNSDMKVIVASVYPLDEQKKRIIDAYDYFDKSESIDDLLRKVKSALKE